MFDNLKAWFRKKGLQAQTSPEASAEPAVAFVSTWEVSVRAKIAECARLEQESSTDQLRVRWRTRREALEWALAEPDTQVPAPVVPR